MADKLSTFERRIEILFLLINSEKVTLSELSKRYSVHKNTVYNDIAFLGRYAPIRTESGVNGGIFIRENYHCDLFRYLASDIYDKTHLQITFNFKDEYEQALSALKEYVEVV